MMLNTKIPATLAVIDDAEGLAAMPMVSGAPFAYLISYANSMAGRQITAAASSSDIELWKNEKVLLELIGVGGISTYHELDESVVDGKLVNIERFLIDSSALLHVVRRMGKSHAWRVVNSYATNMHHQLASVDTPLLLRVWNSKRNSIASMSANRGNYIMTRTEMLEVGNSMPTIKFRYWSHPFTKYDTWWGKSNDGWWDVFKEITGWKVSADLETVTFTLRIDPNWYYTIPNPWLQNKRKFGMEDLIRLVRMITEYYKLRKVVAELKRTGVPITWRVIKAMSIGNYYDHRKGIKTDDNLHVKINRYYHNLGLAAMFEQARLDGGPELKYVEWNY